ncbi:MAG: hypothetical protein K1X79_08620 [Oligoflexia bacterium]|nr:hypothetical protein [Oligoflexia bacterium]
MANIIIVQNGATQQQLESAMCAVPATLTASMTVISSESPRSLSSEQTHVSSSKYSLTSCLEIALEKSNSDVLIMVDANTTPRAEAIQSLAQGMNDQSIGFMYSPMQSGNETIQLGELSSDTMVTALSMTTSWPLALCAVRRSILKNADISGETMDESMIKMMIAALAQAESIATALTPSNGTPREISNAARARCLKALVNCSNIEELFPHHAWTSHREESAAASYHTLAALFIRYGDKQAALECLSAGDQFEDSPRSLALKGLIAVENGETLTAVANMVSSLQQYEARKKQNNKHYVHFAPSNLEKISTSLNAGLEALNKRDNESALSHFANAVFNFDPFYSQLGVTSLRSTSH